MDRFQPTTIWGIATYRMWNAAALGFTSCAASYVAVANYFVSNTRKGKVAPTLKQALSAPGSTITVNNNVIQKPDVQSTSAVRAVEQAEPKPMPVRDTEITARDEVPGSAGTQMNLGTEKDFTPKPISHGYPGKKRKNRPETKGPGSQTETIAKTRA